MLWQLAFGHVRQRSPYSASKSSVSPVTRRKAASMTDPVTLVHGTYQVLVAGEVLTATLSCAYYPHVVAELELKRPAGAPSREVCIFATDTLEGAAAYLEAQNNGTGTAPHFYEIDMPLAQRAPFRLIHEISNRLKHGREIGSAVGEYWAPTLNWRLWEYFGPSFTVLREVAAPSPEKVVQFRWLYDLDVDKASRLAP